MNSEADTCRKYVVPTCGVSADDSRGGASNVAGRCAQESDFSYTLARSRALAQSTVSRQRRENIRPRIPEAKIWQSQRFQPRFRSSNADLSRGRPTVDLIGCRLPRGLVERLAGFGVDFPPAHGVALAQEPDAGGDCKP